MVGERILGRFVCEQRIGSGGFGTVYRAWDERLHRAVAVKVIDRPGDAGRVAREAQAAARLTHRNIATLYELAVDSECAYLVGELVDGSSLRALARRGELSDRSVAEIGAGAAAGLAHAHRKGVVHRDIKPDNILVPAAGGGAKLVDFGIARVSGEASLTATGAVLGTLAYMAPEQADGLRPGPAADVYSLALTLYECWSGEHPVALGGPAATARAIGEPIPPLEESRPDLPTALTRLIDESLDPDPEQRPLVSELEGALAAGASTLSGEPLAPIEGAPGLTERRLRRAAPWSRRTACGGALAAIMAAVLAWSDATPFLLIVIPLITLVLGLARPRAALAAGTLGTLAWLLLGAGEPGAALIGLFLVAPLLLVPVEPGPSLPLPGLAPLLGLAGLAGAFPAIAALPRSAAERALIGATGYLWLAAAEILTRKDLFLGNLPPAPPNWAQSLEVAFDQVLGSLLSGPVLLGAGIWAAAAVSLPLIVRGRFGALDLLGGILWAATLVTAQRILAGPGGEPGGLLLVVVLGAAVAVVMARRVRTAHASTPSVRGGTHGPPAAEGV